LRCILIVVIKDRAVDQGRKRNYLSAHFVKGKAQEFPTAYIVDPNHPVRPNESLITPLPMQNSVALSVWVTDLQQNPDICDKYGIHLSSVPPTAPKPEPPKAPDSFISEEEPSLEPEKMTQIINTGETAEADLRQMIEESIRHRTDAVSSHQAHSIANRSRCSARHTALNSCCPSSRCP
jgi:hypothetical protein